MNVEVYSRNLGEGVEITQTRTSNNAYHMLGTAVVDYMKLLMIDNYKYKVIFY